MATIRKLTVPENVTLLPGAMQNWSDLETLPTVTDLVGQRALAAAGGARCLAVGAHDIGFLRRLAEVAAELVVVVRAIPDAELIATALPEVSVRCGSLEASLATDERYEVVVALRDVASLASSEDEPVEWRALADRIMEARHASGRLLLGIEAELGPDRMLRGPFPGAADDDAGWSPFATWDASRPRSEPQITRWLEAHGQSARIDAVLSTWAAPTALASNPHSVELRRLWTWAALRAGGEVLPLRSLTLADRSRELAAGWIITVGDGADPATAEIEMAVDGRHVLWATDMEGALYRHSENADATLAYVVEGETLLEQYVTAAANEDTPRLRQILSLWRCSVDELSEGDELAAESSDVALGNAALDAVGRVRWLVPGIEPLSVREAQLRALGELLRTMLSQGLRHPWMSSMHHRTIFEALCAQAGVARPTNPDDYIAGIEEPDPTASNSALRALAERQREELRGAWSRFHWDEREYLAYKASRKAKHAVRLGLTKAKGTSRQVKRRMLGS